MCGGQTTIGTASASHAAVGELASDLCGCEHLTTTNQRSQKELCRCSHREVRSHLVVVGPTAAHAQLLEPAGRPSAPTDRPDRGSRPSTGSTNATDPLGKQRFDISKQADKPLGAILKNLGEQLGLTIEWDAGLPPSAPQTLVTIVANKSKLDDVLDSLATQSQLSIKRVGTKVSVGPKVNLSDKDK